MVGFLQEGASTLKGFLIMGEEGGGREGTEVPGENQWWTILRACARYRVSQDEIRTQDLFTTVVASDCLETIAKKIKLSDIVSQESFREISVFIFKVV